MGRLGKADFKQLKALQERIDKLSKVDFDRFYTEAAKDIASRLLTKVKKRTPVIYGSLRDAWAVLPIEHRGDQYVITVINKAFLRKPFLRAPFFPFQLQEE